MRTLVQSTLWVPEEDDRFYTTLKHVNELLQYEGEYDIYFVDNNSCQRFKNELCKLTIARSNIAIDFLPENKGWNWARNLGFKKAWDDNYDLYIMMDCDIWVNQEDWIERCKIAAQDMPAFMVRFEEAKCKLGSWKSPNGSEFDLYDEGIGSINVVTRKAIQEVGGYDTEVFDNRWGFSDCHLFRRYKKAGYFKNFKGYPSLPCDAVNGQDSEKEYNKILDPIKQKEIEKYNRVFYIDERKVLLGMKPIFFDWEKTFE